MFLAGVFAAAGVSELKPGDRHLARKVLHFFLLVIQAVNVQDKVSPWFNID